MQDTVNFNSIAGICKIHAAIKKFNEEFAQVSDYGNPESTMGTGGEFRAHFKPSSSKNPALTSKLQFKLRIR